MKKVLASVVILCSLIFLVGTSVAEEGITDPILKKLVEKGVLTKEEAISIVDEMKKEKKKAEEKKTEEKKAKWEGSFRMRHDSQWFKKPDKPDRHRERIQMRLGFTYDINPLTQFGFGLGSGEKEDQITLNQSLGDVFELKKIWLEAAYVKHTFFDKKLDIYLGKFKNPFTPHTWIVFDPDLHPEGVAIQARHELGKLTLFLNSGAFPLDEIGGKSSDPWLLGIQGGIKYSEKDKFDFIAGIAHYNYSNVKNIDTKHDKYHGNTITDFRVYNITAKCSFYKPIYIALTADYVYNAATDDNNKGYLFEVVAGSRKIEKFKDLQVFTTYSRLESDATFDEFPDSDFRSGGTNNKGWTLGYRFGLGKGWFHSLKYYITKAVSPQLTTDKRALKENRIQIDLNYVFKF